MTEANPQVAGLVIERLLDAPRERVYKAFSEPARFAQWWGPRDFALEVVKLDFRPGGVCHYRLFNSQGHELWHKLAYAETTPSARIAFVSSFSNAEGATARSPFTPGFPLEITYVVTLTALDGKTALRFTGDPLDATPDERALYEGMRPTLQLVFNGVFDQLAAHLAQA